MNVALHRGLPKNLFNPLFSVFHFSVFIIIILKKLDFGGNKIALRHYCLRPNSQRKRESQKGERKHSCTFFITILIFLLSRASCLRSASCLRTQTHAHTHTHTFFIFCFISGFHGTYIFFYIFPLSLSRFALVLATSFMSIKASRCCETEFSRWREICFLQGLCRFAEVSFFFFFFDFSVIYTIPEGFVNFGG